MLGVFHTYVPLKPITCTKKSQLMKARYNIAYNLSIEDIKDFSFLHYVIIQVSTLYHHGYLTIFIIEGFHLTLSLAMSNNDCFQRSQDEIHVVKNEMFVLSG